VEGRNSIWGMLIVVVAAAALGVTTLGHPPSVTADNEEVENRPLLPKHPYRYTDIRLPEHFYASSGGRRRGQASVMQHDDASRRNPVTDAGVTLGRVLFYDKNLSRNRTIACASCHKQELGFADDRRLSVGFEGGTTRRHSMSLTNVRFNVTGRFFWDERAASLEDQALMPLRDAVEMGMSIKELNRRVRSLSYYPVLFEAAFGDPAINTGRMARAIAQFERTLVSYNTRYDQGRAAVRDAAEPFSNFSRHENRGKRIFMASRRGGGAGCVNCHATDAFIDVGGGRTNNGLDSDDRNDAGIYETTASRRDQGVFRFPSLRNVAVRAPFMHDGRFATLEEVIEHYSTGIQSHPNLGRELRGRNGRPVRFNFSRADKQALVAFLITLTDHQLLEDERFSDPFSAVLTKP
jgi:cytochrome c peroxidase